MKKSITVSVVALLILGGILSFSFTDPGDKYFQIAKNLDIFVTLFKEVNTYYVDEIDPDEVINVGIDAMLNSLDPYTDYIPEDEFDNFRTITTGQYGGIGALVGKRDGYSTILMPFKGYPAYSQGLQIGDKVIKIDGRDIRGLESNEISQLLKGQINTPIRLTIQRYGIEQPFDVDLVRQKITIKNVSYQGMVNPATGYIRLSDFTTDAGREVRTAVQALREKGAKSIILDLRGNPGGLLEEAINVSNVFVDKGSEIVSTKGKIDDWNKTYKAYQDPVDTRIPLVVLINGGSASAAEIVAGVLQDYDRGILLGQKTFGKGLVQATRPLAYNSQLKITTAKYYIPSGRCIQAIDYAHRNADGSAGRIPDSLKVAYKTMAGRVVYDGGGVDPDINIEHEGYAPVTYSLVNNNLIFNYATKYRFENREIAEAREFELSDAEFEEFTDWLGGKELEYTNPTEKVLEELVASAKKEKYYSAIEPEIKQLESEVLKSKQADLAKFKAEIKETLEEEIVSRYYLEEGIVEASFKFDPYIQRALQILEQPEEYSQLLMPSGN